MRQSTSRSSCAPGACSAAFGIQTLAALAAVFALFFIFAVVQSASRAGSGPAAPGCAEREVVAQTAPPPAPPVPPAPAKLIVAGAGDVILHGRVHLSARQRANGDENNQGYDELFREVPAALAGVDLAIANLEFPILKEHKPPKPFIFSGDPPALRAALRAGFSAFTSANNHSYDQGRQGPAHTAHFCREEQAVCLGVGDDRQAAEAPYLFTKNGMRLMVIGYSLVANDNLNSERKGSPRVNGYAFEGLLAQVTAAAAQSDCVVVAVHWGEEYREQPLPSQREQAQKMIDAGACLVLGHHPHVLEPVEQLTSASGRKALVAYSLGNFVSNQERSRPEHQNRIGAILRAELTSGAAGVEVTGFEALPVWTRNQTEHQGSRSWEEIEVVVLPTALADTETRMASASPDEKKQLERDAEFYRGRIAHARRMMNLD